jgi:hypothetical protein
VIAVVARVGGVKDVEDASVVVTTVVVLEVEEVAPRGAVDA